MDDIVLSGLRCSSSEDLGRIPQSEFQDRFSELFEQGQINEHTLLVGSAEWMAEQVPSIPLVNHLSTSPAIERWCAFLCRLGCPKTMVLDYFTRARERRARRQDGGPKPVARLWNFAKRIMDTAYDRKKAETVRRNKPLCAFPAYSASPVNAVTFTQPVCRDDHLRSLSDSAQRAAAANENDSLRPHVRSETTGQFIGHFMDGPADDIPLDGAESPYRKRQKMTERLRGSDARQTHQTADVSSQTNTFGCEAERDQNVQTGRVWEEWRHDRWDASPDADREERREKKSRVGQRISQRKRSESPARNTPAAFKPDLMSSGTARHESYQPPETGRLSPWEDFDARSPVAEARVAVPVALTEEQKAMARADDFLDELADELTARHHKAFWSE